MKPEHKPESGSPTAPSKTLKQRLDENIVWIAGGCFLAGIAGGLLLAKDSALAALLHRPSAQSAATNLQSPQVPAQNAVSKHWNIGQVLGRYRQSSAIGAGNCETCILTIRTVSPLMIAFETNNGVIGSAYQDTATGKWIGHAQFVSGTQGWDNVVMKMQLTFDRAGASVSYSAIGGASWTATYVALPSS